MLNTKKESARTDSIYETYSNYSTHLTRQQVISYLGNDYKQEGVEYLFQCPECAKEGQDKAGNNLKYNTQKEVLHCFVNPDHSKNVYKDILNANKKVVSFNKKLKSTNTIKITEENILKYNNHLLTNNDLIEEIKEIGIEKETIKDCKIGFSEECQVWIFPAYDLEGQLFGAEYRKRDFTCTSKGAKAWKAKGTESKLCRISYISEPQYKPKKVIILAGFKDAYNFYQYIESHDPLREEYLILTPSNGEGNIKNPLKNFDPAKYIEIDEDSKIVLLLDNDKAGRKAINDCALSSDIMLYQTKIPYCECCKDFTDWYLNHYGTEKDVLIDNIKLIALSVAVNIIKNRIGELGKECIIPLNSDIDISLSKQIIAYRNNYFEIWTTYETKKDLKKDSNTGDISKKNSKETKEITLHYTRLSNYTIELAKNIIDVDTENTSNECHNLEVVINYGYDKKSKPKILTPAGKSKLLNFREAISERGTFYDIFNDTQFKKIIVKLSEESTTKDVYRYNNMGLIPAESLWLYDDAIIDIEHKTIYKKNNYSDCIKISNNKEVTLNDDITDRPLLNHSDSIDLKALAKELIENLHNGYGASIESFMAAGLSIMAPHSKQIIKERGGFPMGWLYGTTATGKTNMLTTIACLFGFDKDFIQSGSSTVNKMWRSVSQYSSMPVLLDETTSKLSNDSNFEGFMKSMYSQTKKGACRSSYYKGGDIAPRSTLFISSNHQPPQKDAVLNRLIYLDFKPESFNVSEIKKFNKTRGTKLSNLLPAFLFVDQEEITNIIDESKIMIESISSDLAERDINNIAIAFTGIKLLFKVAEENFESYQELNKSFQNYVNTYTELCKPKPPLDEFLEYLPLLRKDDKINDPEHYTIRNNQLIIDFKIVFKRFLLLYKNTNKPYSLTEKEFKNEIKNDSRIIKGSAGLLKATKLNGETQRCLVIDLKDDEDLEIQLDNRIDRAINYSQT